MSIFRMMEIFDQFRARRNSTEGKGMQAYMKGKFEFLGVKRPIRNELQKDFIREKKKEKRVDENFIRVCWSQPEREFQYLGWITIGRLFALQVQTI